MKAPGARLRRGTFVVRRAVTRALFGESEQLLRVQLAAMPRPFVPWYWLAGGVAHLFFRLYARWDRVGLENLPRQGGFLFASNHLASADPPMLAAAMYPRWPKYMAKIELFQKPWVGYLFALSGAFPVRRFESDLGALREARRLLEAGEAVGMFPEGHRSDTGALIEAHPGTALIALRARVPIVPVAITGSERFRRGPRVFFQRPRVRVVFGRPFHLEHEGPVNRAAVEAATERIMREIAARLPAPYRGVYRERFPDLPPEALPEDLLAAHGGAGRAFSLR